MNSKARAGIFVLAILGFVLAAGCINNLPADAASKNRPTALIFKLKNSYETGYLGPIKFDSDTNKYETSYLIPLFDCCFETNMGLVCNNAKKLQNGYFATNYPNSESMVKLFAIFNKSIKDKARGQESECTLTTEELSQSEFFSFVIDESPIAEAYFCDRADGTPYPAKEEDYDAIVLGLSNGEITKGCKKII